MSDDAAVAGEPLDPIRVQRAHISMWISRAQRVGYVLFALAMVSVTIAVLTGFPAGLLRIATWSLLAGSAVLAPAIIAAYTVKAAERDDLERGL